MSAICLVGALDTKGAEYGYLKELIEKEGFKAIVVNTGIIGEPSFTPDYSADDVAVAGGMSRAEIIEKKDPGLGVAIMGKGARKIVKDLYDRGEIQGCAALGGGQGSFMACEAMADLPVGFPKVLASTISFVAHDATMKDIKDGYVADTVVDVCGLNSILMRSIENAAGAICGMAKLYSPIKNLGKKRIAITMFGVTTKCVEEVMAQLGGEYEVQIYHSTGMGGKYMEELVLEGAIDAVMDLTMGEISQSVTHGTCAGIPTRLEAAGDMGLPQVVSFGGVDTINTSPELLAKLKQEPDRMFHMHNPTLTLARMNRAESIETARLMAEKLNRAKGPVTVLIPLKGVSAYDKEGMFFYDPEADKAMFEEFKRCANENIRIIELDCHINDKEFADTAAQIMKEMLK